MQVVGERVILQPRFSRGRAANRNCQAILRVLTSSFIENEEKHESYLNTDMKLLTSGDDRSQDVILKNTLSSKLPTYYWR